MTEKNANYSITIELNPDKNVVEIVNKNLSSEAEFGAGFEKKHLKAGIIARDRSGALLGGLIAEFEWRWMHVSNIWITERFRGKGIGTKLIEAAESEALNHGCKYAYLETFSYQARPFYERFGYELFGTLDDFPPEFKKYFMKKKLG